MNTQKLKLPCLALALLVQPLCMRAFLTTENALVIGVGVVAAGVVIREVYRPEDIESLIARARNLDEAKGSLVRDWQSYRYDGSEEELRLFAQRNIRELFDDTKRDVASTKNAIEQMRDTMHARMRQLDPGRAEYADIRSCINSLDGKTLTLKEILDYMVYHQDYLKLYALHQHAVGTLEGGFFVGDKVRAERVARAINDIKQARENARGIEGSSLDREVRATYTRLLEASLEVKERIAKKEQEERDAKAYQDAMKRAARIIGTIGVSVVDDRVEQERQATIQRQRAEQQRAAAEIQRQVDVRVRQINVQRQQEEQERADLEHAKQASLVTQAQEKARQKDEEDFLELTKALANAHQLYDALVKASPEEATQIIKRNGVGSDKANAVKLYLENLRINMENTKKLVDTVCAKDQFKNRAECRDIKNFAQVLAAHFKAIQAVASKAKL